MDSQRKNKFHDQKRAGLTVQSRHHILFSPVTITFTDLSVKGRGQVVKGEQPCSWSGREVADTSSGMGWEHCQVTKFGSLEGLPGCPAAEQLGSESPWQRQLKRGGSRVQPPPHIQQLPELPSAEPGAAPAQTYWSSWLRPSPADGARENQGPAVPFPLPSSSRASLRAALTAATSQAAAVSQHRFYFPRKGFVKHVRFHQTTLIAVFHFPVRTNGFFS